MTPSGITGMTLYSATSLAAHKVLAQEAWGNCRRYLSLKQASFKSCLIHLWLHNKHRFVFLTPVRFYDNIFHYFCKNLTRNPAGVFQVLNDKNRTIFYRKYCKGFLILVLGKRMEILYYFKPFDTKIIIRQVDYFLFLLAISSKYNFFHLFLIAVVNLVRKQLLRFYGD